MNKHQLRSDLIAFLIAESGLTEDEIASNAHLFSSGLLDSMDLMKLVAFLEQFQGAPIHALDIGMDAFDSVDRIVAYLDSMKGS